MHSKLNLIFPSFFIVILIGSCFDSESENRSKYGYGLKIPTDSETENRVKNRYKLKVSEDKNDFFENIDKINEINIYSWCVSCSESSFFSFCTTAIRISANSLKEGSSLKYKIVNKNEIGYILKLLNGAKYNEKIDGIDNRLLLEFKSESRTYNMALISNDALLINDKYLYEIDSRKLISHLAKVYPMICESK